jgi:N-acetylmuramoyl-L-alanine amidase
MFTLPTRRLLVPILAAILVALTAAPRPVEAAASAKAQYERALARETAARRSSRTSVKTLRSIAKAYEAIVRQYPRSGYSDNALWQAAGLWATAYERTHSTSDRTQAKRMLTWLDKEYPSSSLRAKIDDRLEALNPAKPKPAPSRLASTGRKAPAAPRPTPFPRAERQSSADTTPAEKTPASSAAAPPAATTPAPAVVRAAAEAAHPAASTAAVELRAIEQTPLPRGERVTLQLSREATYSVARTSPERLVITLPGAAPGPKAAALPASSAGRVVRGIRTAPAPRGTEVVIELAGEPRFSTFPLYDPFRLAVDIETDTPLAPAPAARTASTKDTPATPELHAVDTPAATATADVVRTATLPPPPAPPAITSHGDYSLARQLGLGISRIVIDPGHGGHDPGAQANGITEADLVLDISLRLEKLLQAQPGVEVVLTRRTDTFIPLEERTAIANREGADLFLSIHANASKRTAARGIETFILNFATNPDAEATAARENASSAQAMGTLPSIVKAIALNNKLAESRELADAVQTSLTRHLHATSPTKGLRDLGVKQAPFVVLIGAQMPSVLAEVSFLTNKSDAALLKKSDYRQRVAQALCDAVLKYQASLKKVTAVASRREAQ